MDNKSIYTFLIELFLSNKKTKKEELKTINNFKYIYNLTKEYQYLQKKYDDIITNPDIRYEFLINSIDIVFENHDIDELTKDLILQMYEEIYNYLYKDSQLNEIEIPEELINNIFSKKIVPNTAQLNIIILLLKENKRIYDTEIKNKYFSQKLDQGLHSGITKELKIEEENLSHLLGLTNDGSLYEFYRKTILDNIIKQISDSLENDYDINEFNLKFKEIFGLDYTKENYIKIINWRYNAKEDYLEKKGITVTKEERIILNDKYNYAPKSKTIDFYTNDENIQILIEENNKIKSFIIDYIKKDIIKKSFNKNTYNELKKVFTKEEIDKIIKSSNIEQEIFKYLKESNYSLEEDKEFKTKFINTFGYSYPLINYSEVLSKNISFYNFSLFKNLNSIIVDYSAYSKKIESDVFLASYSQNKIDDINNMIKKLLEEKNKEYTDAVNARIYPSNLDKNYIMNLISLLSFKEDLRYYFKLGIIDEDTIKQDNKIIKENTSPNHNITLIGFKTSNEEVERLYELESTKRKRIKHFLNCETNITSNYYQYITDFTKYGIEYPIDILDERSNLPYNRKRKILKIVKPLDKLSKYITLFELSKYKLNNSNPKELTNLKYIAEEIYKIIDTYKKMTLLKISIMRYRQSNSHNSNQNIETEQIIANKNNEQFNQYLKYINETISYYENIKRKTK